jgi:hypothetical protein
MPGSVGGLCTARCPPIPIIGVELPVCGVSAIDHYRVKRTLGAIALYEPFECALRATKIFVAVQIVLDFRNQAGAAGTHGGTRRRNSFQLRGIMIDDRIAGSRNEGI